MRIVFKYLWLFISITFGRALSILSWLLLNACSVIWFFNFKNLDPFDPTDMYINGLDFRHNDNFAIYEEKYYKTIMDYINGKEVWIKKKL